MAEKREADATAKIEFAKRKKRQIVASVLLVLALIPVFLVDNAGPEGLGLTVVVGAVCIAVIVGIAVFSFLNWRCPVCKGYLGKGMSPKFCHKCGAQLQ